MALNHCWFQFTYQTRCCSLRFKYSFNNFEQVHVTLEPYSCHLHPINSNYIFLFEYSNKPTSMIFQLSFIPFCFKRLSESICFSILQPFSHIQNITTNANIIVSLKWHNLSLSLYLSLSLSIHLNMNQMIIIDNYNHSLNYTNIHSKNLHLK